jgi:hypothetical protein
MYILLTLPFSFVFFGNGPCAFFVSVAFMPLCCNHEPLMIILSRPFFFLCVIVVFTASFFISVRPYL